MLSNILLYTDCFIEPNAWYLLFIAISQNTASFVITLPGGREVEDSQWTTHCPLRVGVGLNGLLIDLHELVGDEFFLSLVSAAIARNIAPFVVILSSGGEGWKFIIFCPWWPVVMGEVCLFVDYGFMTWNSSAAAKNTALYLVKLLDGDGVWRFMLS